MRFRSTRYTILRSASDDIVTRRIKDEELIKKIIKKTHKLSPEQIETRVVYYRDNLHNCYHKEALITLLL